MDSVHAARLLVRAAREVGTLRSLAIGGLVHAPIVPMVEPCVRLLGASRKEGALHHAADLHTSQLSVALRYAFARGRKALGRDANVEAAVKAVAAALREVLPGTLRAVAAEGGRVAVDGLRTLGDVEGHPFHGNQWTNVPRIEDTQFKPGDRVVFRGKPATFISRTVKHREIEQDGKRLFVAAFRVKKLETLGDVEGHPFHGNQWTGGIAGVKDKGVVTHPLLYHGAPRDPKNFEHGGLVFMSTSFDEAVGYATQGKGGEPKVYQVRAAPAGKTADIQGVIESALAETGDPDKAMQDIAPKLKEKGFAYMTYDLFDGGKVVVSLNPTKDLKVVGKNRVKRSVRSMGFRTAKRQAPSKKFGPLTMRFDKNNQRVVDWADRHAAELITNISETTREAINNAVAEALEQGSIKDLYDEILDAVGDEARADLIARTEVMTAANEGQREAWRQAADEGLLPANIRIGWIATVGACPECEVLDGQTRSLDGEYEGGVVPPAHPRCRCTEGIVG